VGPRCLPNESRDCACDSINPPTLNRSKSIAQPLPHTQADMILPCDPLGRTGASLAWCRGRGRTVPAVRIGSAQSLLFDPPTLAPPLSQPPSCVLPPPLVQLLAQLRFILSIRSCDHPTSHAVPRLMTYPTMHNRGRTGRRGAVVWQDGGGLLPGVAADVLGQGA